MRGAGQNMAVESMKTQRLRHQRWRLIQVADATYRWIPFEHCVCVWDRTVGRKQFARHGDRPVTLASVARFIRQVFLQEPPPAERRIALPGRDRYGFFRGEMYRGQTAILGSFTDPAQAELAADRRNPPYVNALKKMIEDPDFGLPTDEPLPPDADEWRNSVQRRGWFIYQALTVDLFEI